MRSLRPLAVALLLASPLLVISLVGPAARAESSSPEELSGPVRETMDSGGYTYVRIDGPDGAPVWAAATAFPVKVGQVVRFPTAMRMQGYHSNTLDRTFDAVYFASRIEVEGAAAAPGATSAPGGEMPSAMSAHGAPAGTVAPGAALPPGHPAPQPQRVVDLREVTVERIAEADGGRTIGEILDGRKDLAGKPVRVRGKVVKLTENVMGKNWLHLRDGTAGAEGVDDLTVTTAASAKLGDVVVVSGDVSLDRSFGHGYTYPVILEDAAVTVE